MATHDALAGLTILLVEDEYYLADDMRIILEDAGASIIGPFATVEKAHAAVREVKFDCAILDINLNGKHSFEIASLLVERNIAFIFVSGYDAAIIPKDLQHVPSMTKPIGTAALLRCVAEAADRPLAERAPAI
ncbi:response regulator [Rhizobiaceae sp. 2RAB30]